MAKELTKEQKREEALKLIQKKLGTEALVLYNSKDTPKDYPHFPTGLVGLDYRVLGIGGFAKGRIVEIYGPNASGKTTLTLVAIAACQKAGGTCAFIDVENALDISRAAALGVNVDALHISQPSNAEEALDLAIILANSGGFDLIVIDSVASLTPQKEIDGEAGDAHVGLQARLLSSNLRKMTSMLSSNDCTLLLVNQERAKIGGMGYGPQTETAGGNAPKYYSSVRLEIKRIGQIKGKDPDGISDEVVIGQRVKIKATKNKLAAPFREAEFDLMYDDNGLSKEADLFDLGEKFGFITKQKNTYFYGPEKLGVGRAASIEEIKKDSKLFNELFTSIRDRLKNVAVVAPTASIDEETGEIEEE